MFDCFTTLPLGVMKKPGTLMNSTGQVRSGGLFQEENFANDLVMIESGLNVFQMAEKSEDTQTVTP